MQNKQGFCYQYAEKNAECIEHYHLICEECGKLIHFESNKLNEVQKEAKQKENFKINLSKIVLYGKCKKCNRREVWV